MGELMGGETWGDVTAVASLTFGFAPAAHAVAAGLCTNMSAQLASRQAGVPFGVTTGPNAVEITMSTPSCLAFPVTRSVTLDANVNTVFGTQFSCLYGIGGVPPFASGGGMLNSTPVNVTLISVAGGVLVSVGTPSLPLIAVGFAVLPFTQCATPWLGTGELFFYDPGFLTSTLQQAQSATS